MIEPREKYIDEQALELRDNIVEAFDLDATAAKEFAERLGNAFNWHASPQGYAFWFAVSQALNALAQRHR